MIAENLMIFLPFSCHQHPDVIRQITRLTMMAAHFGSKAEHTFVEEPRGCPSYDDVLTSLLDAAAAARHGAVVISTLGHVEEDLLEALHLLRPPYIGPWALSFQPIVQHGETSALTLAATPVVLACPDGCRERVVAVVNARLPQPHQPTGRMYIQVTLPGAGDDDSWSTFGA